MLGNTLKKVTWMARATTTIVGLAIMLALVFGVATTALAGTGVGATFNLGQTNTVDAISKLVGSVAGPSLQIDNNSTDASATALDLQVEAGKAPLKVSANAGKATNLNSDKLDGKDSSQFLSTINVRSVEVSTPANSNGFATANCLPGEKATGGIVGLVSGNAAKISYFEPGGRPVGNPPNAWQSAWFAREVPATVRVSVMCAS
jgi:hypothetical protein